MKNFFLSVITLIIISAVCIVSCPKHEDHSKAIMKEINTIIDEEISDNAETDGEIAIALVATTICSGISEIIIEKKLHVDNYFLFSIGKITFNGETNIVSFGVLNHIFTDLNEDIKNKLMEL